MTIVTPSAAEKDLLDMMLGVNVAGTQHALKLFTNNVTPDDTFVLANLTEMGAVLGYTHKLLTKTSWVTAAGITGQPATGTYATQTWTFTAGTPVDVYGYHIIDVTLGRLLWVELFPAKKTLGNVGDQIIITPTITFSRG